jgi:hypothetical protein
VIRTVVNRDIATGVRVQITGHAAQVYGYCVRLQPKEVGRLDRFKVRPSLKRFSVNVEPFRVVADDLNCSKPPSDCAFGAVQCTLECFTTAGPVV